MKQRDCGSEAIHCYSSSDCSSILSDRACVAASRHTDMRSLCHVGREEAHTVFLVAQLGSMRRSCFFLDRSWTLPSPADDRCAACVLVEGFVCFMPYQDSPLERFACGSEELYCYSSSGVLLTKQSWDAVTFYPSLSNARCVINTWNYSGFLGCYSNRAKRGRCCTDEESPK